MWNNGSVRNLKPSLALISFALFTLQLSAPVGVIAAEKKPTAKRSGMSMLEQFRKEDDRYALRLLLFKHPELNRNARALSELALNYATVRWLNEAIEASDKALKLSPNDPYVLSSRAWILNNNKTSNVAVAPAKLAVQLDPNARNLAILAEVLQACDRPSEADDALAKARKADPNSFDLTASNARILIARLKGPEALALLSGYLKTHPDDMRALTLRSELADMMGKRKQAIADLTAILKRKPEHSFALQKRAEVYQKEKEYALASADIRKLLTLDGDAGVKIVASKTLSECEESLGNIEAAYKARAKILEIECQPYKNDLTIAIQNLSFDFVKDTVDCARLEIALKRYASAFAKLNSILNYYPNNSKARELRAYSLEGLSRWKEALADWSRLITRQPTYPKWYENRARVYKKLGKEDAANKDLETARKLSE